MNDGRRRIWLSQEDIFQGDKKEIDRWSVEIVVEKDSGDIEYSNSVLEIAMTLIDGE